MYRCPLLRHCPGLLAGDGHIHLGAQPAAIAALRADEVGVRPQGQVQRLPGLDRLLTQPVIARVNALADAYPQLADRHIGIVEHGQ